MLVPANESKVDEALGNGAWSFTDRLSEADRVRLYFTLLSPTAKQALLERLEYSAIYGRDEKPVQVSPLIEPDGSHKTYCKGIVAGLIAAIALMCLSIGAYQLYQLSGSQVEARNESLP